MGNAMSALGLQRRLNDGNGQVVQRSYVKEDWPLIQLIEIYPVIIVVLAPYCLVPRLRFKPPCKVPAQTRLILKPDVALLRAASKHGDQHILSLKQYAQILSRELDSGL
jgi:hypothetical protein